MVNLTKRDMSKALHRVESMKRRYHNAIAKSEETMTHVVHGVEASAASFGFGVLQGRFASKGGLGIMGVPIELAAGGALYLAAALGLGGKMSEHFYALGQGALSAFTTTMGRGVGVKMLSSGGSTAAVHGEATLSPAELHALANPTGSR